jgi:hypothetical protein
MELSQVTTEAINPVFANSAVSSKHLRGYVLKCKDRGEYVKYNGGLEKIGLRQRIDDATVYKNLHGAIAIRCRVESVIMRLFDIVPL